MSRRSCALVAAAALALLVGCSDPEPPPEPRANGAEYVALGDSFVSGPGIARQDPVDVACLRSDRNYPGLVAEELGITSFEDVSCGGASTESVRDGLTTDQGEDIAPQLDALALDTELVTIGLGANDGGASAGLFSYCLIPASATEEGCSTFITDYMPTLYPQIEENLGIILDEVTRLSPSAQVVLTGYSRIVPEAGDCVELRLTETARAAGLEWETEINQALRAVAEDKGIDYVDLEEASRGHDVCAGDEAWVNGIENPPGDGMFLHPNAAGMQGVAAEVLKVVDRA